MRALEHSFKLQEIDVILTVIIADLEDSPEKTLLNKAKKDIRLAKALLLNTVTPFLSVITS